VRIYQTRSEAARHVRLSQVTINHWYRKGVLKAKLVPHGRGKERLEITRPDLIKAMRRMKRLCETCFTNNLRCSCNDSDIHSYDNNYGKEGAMQHKPIPFGHRLFTSVVVQRAFGKTAKDIYLAKQKHAIVPYMPGKSARHDGYSADGVATWLSQRPGITFRLLKKTAYAMALYHELHNCGKCAVKYQTELDRKVEEIWENNPLQDTD